jgi:hypothetical protein
MVFFGIVVVSNFVFVRNLGDGEGVVCVCDCCFWGMEMDYGFSDCVSCFFGDMIIIIFCLKMKRMSWVFEKE